MKKDTQKDISFTEHQRRAAKARHAKRTPEERSAHAKKMVAAREAKRRADREARGVCVDCGGIHELFGLRCRRAQRNKRGTKPTTQAVQ